MSKIIQNMKKGYELKPLSNAGSFFEDGFVLILKKNGLKGFSEIMTSTVIDLERRGLILFNSKLWQYVLTKKALK